MVIFNSKHVFSLNNINVFYGNHINIYLSLLHYHTYLPFNTLSPFYIQLLFIAPVYGKRKPQISFVDILEEENHTSKGLEVPENNVLSTHQIFELKRARTENIVRRPSKRGSKV